MISAPLLAALLSVQSYPPPFPREGATKILENESVVVWNVVWERGKPTPMHEHRQDLVGVTLVEGSIKVVLPDGGSRELGPEELEEVSFGGKGIIHREEGTSEVPRRAILIELKETQKPPLEAPEGVPLAWPREGAEKVLENDRVVVWKYEFRPDRTIPLHFHDKDTVVVELEPGATRSVPRDGAPSETKWTGMTARFSPRGRIHREEVLSDAFRAVLVEVK